MVRINEVRSNKEIKLSSTLYPTYNECKLFWLYKISIMQVYKKVWRKKQ